MTNSIKHQLDALEQQYELILQATGEGIYGLNQQGETTFLNRAAEEMVGWTQAELQGKCQHNLIHHTKADGSPYLDKTCPIYAAFKDGQVHHVDDEVFWRKDGTSFAVEYVSTPIKDSHGKLLGAVVCFKDITERKEARLALEETNRRLVAALEQVEQLKHRLELENAYLQGEIKLTHNFEEIISCSKTFKQVLRKVEQVAPTDATVLVCGESGTGKELIARAIHNHSGRKGKALVKVNCAALPESLIESELFGHERGAFTGAINQKMGRFELADGGTIFLDEIGEFPVNLQPKLLRVLQEGEFERLGSTITKKVNVRVIAATNRNLKAEVDKGNFRLDLYYRLNVFPIQVHSLRERKDDIPLLADFFLRKFSLKFSKKFDPVSQKVVNRLMDYSWPGNIRELENVMERSAIISRGPKLELSDALQSGGSEAESGEITTLAENEKKHILKALELTQWRVSGERGAAVLLGLRRTTLEARMAKLGITRRD